MTVVARYNPGMAIVRWPHLLLLLALVMLGAPAQAQAPSPVLLVVGDSISAGYGLAKGQGWVDLLAARLRETGHREQVVNASISGDTTAGGRARLPVLLREQRPAIVAPAATSKVTSSRIVSGSSPLCTIFVSEVARMMLDMGGS